LATSAALTIVNYKFSTGCARPLTLLWLRGDCGQPQKSDGYIMRRVIVIAAAGLSLAGCSSFSMDSLRPAPTPVTIQLDSTPPGADAVTSLGPSCKTPCSLPITADSSFSVTFNLPKYAPLTVPVTVTKTPGDFVTAAVTVVDPNPVVGELQPATPPRRARKPVRRKPAAAAAPAAAEPAGGTTPFPAPSR
jgi:hypothetical protein